jgi:hypothetical protein
MRALIAFVVFSGLGLAGAASAQSGTPAASEAASSGVSFGVRIGYGLPMGRMGADSTGDLGNLSDGIRGMVPLSIDVGYRPEPRLYVGALFQYAFALLNKDQRVDCSNCSAQDLVVAVNVRYHPLPGRQLDPWVGVGLGYEVLTVSASATFPNPMHLDSLDPEPPFTRLERTASFRGIQYLIAQLGCDILASPKVSMGPFLSLTVGEYAAFSGSQRVNGQSSQMSDGLSSTAIHGWVALGIRGQFNL